MANILELNATTRQRSGSSSVRRLRKEGLVPGVVYGRKTENANIKVNTKTVSQLLKESATDNILVNLQIDGSKTQLALIQKVQHDHLTLWMRTTPFTPKCRSKSWVKLKGSRPVANWTS